MSAAILALVAGAIVAASQARAARLEARHAERISEFLQSILGANLTNSAYPRRLPQANLTVQQVLDTAAAHLPVDLHDDPSVRATLHLVLGRAFAAATRIQSAQVQLDSALAIHSRIAGPRDTLVARDELELGIVVVEQDPDSAAKLFRDALSIIAAYHVPDTAGLAVDALAGYATAQSYHGELAASEASYTAWLAAERRRAHPRLPEIAAVLGALGYTLHNDSKPDSAEATMRHGIALLDSTVHGPTSDEADALFTFGSHLLSRGKVKEAVAVLERSHNMASQALPPGSTVHLMIEMYLADALSQSGDTAAAHRTAQHGLARIAALPPGAKMFRFIAQYAYAKMLRREHRWAEAEAAARTQYKTGVDAAQTTPYYLSDTHYLLGVVLSDRGKFPEAETHLRAAYQVARDKLGADNRRTKRDAAALALLYFRSRRDSEAGPYLPLLSRAEVDSIREKARLVPGR